MYKSISVGVYIYIYISDVNVYLLLFTKYHTNYSSSSPEKTFSAASRSAWSRPQGLMIHLPCSHRIACDWKKPIYKASKFGFWNARDSFLETNVAQTLTEVVGITKIFRIKVSYCRKNKKCSHFLDKFLASKKRVSKLLWYSAFESSGNGLVCMVYLCLDAAALALDFKQDILFASTIRLSILSSLTKQTSFWVPPARIRCAARGMAVYQPD